MGRFTWIEVAGALGTWCRYLIGLWAGRALGTSFPYGTLIVNVVGCFLTGAAMQVALSVPSIPTTARLALILDEMLTGGALVTMETVRVLKYAAGPKGAT